MDIKKQQRAVVDALEDIKAQDIQVFNTEELTSLFDRVVIATATSNRQTRALANSVEDKARELGIPVIATEGEETGEWVLVDLGDVVVHIMQPAIRQYYNLEEIWGGKPVRMKIGGPPPSKRAVKTLSQTVTKAPAKKTTKTAVKKTSKKAASLKGA
ncbi:ribosome silencing factor [Orrella daihaiensis]|uniref:Ribosomal silencing factor RsfS n=1 Tax=Orrella daihaiensis TaxID=2782176 RepID=A0ABY4AHT1_9BURK|nr:ribosome silencing factor [Orrella daihaiensis]UOD49196.1 ribosome silencing factor [Orrella daihaiensis]